MERLCGIEEELADGIVKSLMYAFGDVANPDPETVAVLEDILQEYVINMVSVERVEGDGLGLIVV